MALCYPVAPKKDLWHFFKPDFFPVMRQFQVSTWMIKMIFTLPTPIYALDHVNHLVHRHWKLAKSILIPSAPIPAPVLVPVPAPKRSVFHVECKKTDPFPVRKTFKHSPPPHKTHRFLRLYTVQIRYTNHDETWKWRTLRLSSSCISVVFHQVQNERFW